MLGGSLAASFSIRPPAIQPIHWWCCGAFILVTEHNDSVPTPFGMWCLDGLVGCGVCLSELLSHFPNAMAPRMVPEPFLDLTLAVFPKDNMSAIVYQQEFLDASP